MLNMCQTHKHKSHLCTSLQRSENKVGHCGSAALKRWVCDRRDTSLIMHCLRQRMYSCYGESWALRRSVCLQACVFESSPPTQTLKLQMWSSRTITVVKDGGRSFCLWSLPSRLPQIAILQNRKSASRKESVTSFQILWHNIRGHKNTWKRKPWGFILHLKSFQPKFRLWNSFAFFLLTNYSQDLHLFCW